MRAEDTVRSDIEAAALQIVRDATGRDSSPLERHSLRVLLVAEELAGRHGGAGVDREVLAVAAWLHDVGLYTGIGSSYVYVTDGRRTGAELLEGTDWSPPRRERCLDAIEHHHELTPQWARGPEVELIRRADLVELTFGAIRFGLSRRRLAELHRGIPVLDFLPVVFKQLAVAHRRNPVALARLFRP